MWLGLAFISACLLGLYDLCKKVSLDKNAVIPVLFQYAILQPFFRSAVDTLSMPTGVDAANRCIHTAVAIGSTSLFTAESRHRIIFVDIGIFRHETPSFNIVCTHKSLSTRTNAFGRIVDFR